MLKNIVLFWSLTCLLSCLEVNIPKTEPPCIGFCDTITPIEIIWKTPIVEDSSEEIISMYPKISDSMIIFSNLYYKGQPEIFKGFNKFDGRQVWNWPFPHPQGGETYVAAKFRNKYITSNQLTLSIATYYYNIDIRNGSVESGTRIVEYAQNARINVFGDKVYFTMYTWPPSDTMAFLCSMDLMFSRVDTLAKHVHRDGAVQPSISLEPPSFWVRPDGDTIAVYVLRGYSGPNQSWYEVHALNLSEKTEDGYEKLWIQDSFPHDDNCNVAAEPIFYRDSLLIFPGQGAVYGISLATGDQVYRTPIPEDLLTTDFILADDQVLFVDNPGNFHILDAKTGEILDIIPDCGGNVSNMEEHDGIVYFTSAGDGRLYAVDIRNRKVVWRWKSPHKREQGYAQFTSAGVAIDRKKEWLYTSDRVYAMCMELYERE